MTRIRISPFIEILSLAVFGAAFIFTLGTAHAVQIFHLTNTNANPAIDITVRITVSDGCAGTGDCTLRVQLIANTALGFDQFG
jgi:hypothetical protein